MSRFLSNNPNFLSCTGALSSEYKGLSTDAHIHTLVNGSLSIRNVQRNDEGYYMCQATNGIGSGISTVITLSIRGIKIRHSKFQQLRSYDYSESQLACERSNNSRNDERTMDKN